MKTCTDYQAQTLDHLYGLLELDEGVAFRSHLAECAACRDALVRAERQKQLFAMAARTGSVSMPFQAPTVSGGNVPNAPGRMPRRWVVTPRWAVAAALLLMLASGNILGAYWYQSAQANKAWARAERAELEVQVQQQAIQNRLALATQKAVDAETEFQRMFSARQVRLAEAQRDNAAHPLHVRLTGPQTIEPGAANDFTLVVNDRFAQTVPARISAQLVGRDQKALPGRVEVRNEQRGIYRLSLPRDLPLTPDAEVYLMVKAGPESASAGSNKNALTVAEKLNLIAPVYQTHLAIDKPMYLPGETVHFRSLTLERFSHKPGADDLHLLFTVLGPTGDELWKLEGTARVSNEAGLPVLGPDQQPIRGIGAGEYAIPAEAPGGEYTLRVSDTAGRFPPQLRRFLVNRYEKPRLNKELEFTRKSYGPGDEVIAACKVARAEGGTPVAGQPVTATIKIDGKTYDTAGKEGASIRLQTNSDGGANVRFRLPTAIERGDASLAVTFEDGGSTETLVRSIPLVLKRLQVEFFPEGGDLVAGVSNRVYFQARTMLDKPAELTGHVVDDRGQTVVAVRTFNDPAQPGANQGMGSFELTPQVGRRYELKIGAPVGVEGKYALPEIQSDGVVLSIRPGAQDDHSSLRLTLTSGREDRSLIVGAYCRGRLMAYRRVQAAKGQPTDVDLRPETGVGGVYRITVYEELPRAGGVELRPRAERLIYRAPTGRLDLAIQADKPHYVPGDPVRLHVRAKDERKQVAPAVVMVAVVDKSVLKMADEKTYRSLPTTFLLTSEVRRPEDLEYADFLLSPHPSAATALDLLLGTQGWRRFAEQDPDEFLKKQPKDGAALLASNGRFSSADLGLKTRDFDRLALDRIAGEYDGKLDAIKSHKEAVAKEFTAVQAGQTSARSQLAGLQQAINQAHREYQDARASLDGYRTAAGLVGLLLMPVLGILLLGALAAGNPGRSLLYASGAVCALLLVLKMMPLDLSGKRTGSFGDRQMAINVKALAHTREAAAPARMQTAKRTPLAVAPPAPEARPNPHRGMRDGVMPEEFGLRRQAAKNELPLEAGRIAAQMKPQDLAPRGDMRNRGQAEEAKGKGAANDRLAKEGQLLPDLREFVVIPNDAKAPAAGLIVPPEPSPPFVLREYAHPRIHGSGGARTDLAETLCWQPVLVLPDGTADTVLFHLCDSVTTFQVLVAGHTLDGRLGATTIDLESRLPLTVEPKLPIQVTAGDLIDIPVAVANNTNEPRAVRLAVQARDLQSVDGKANDEWTIAAQGRGRRVFRFQPSTFEGEAELRLEAEIPGFATDRSVRSFKIVPEGFPVLGTQSDLLEKLARHELVLPDSWLKGSLKYQVSVYPSTLAELQKGLEALLREPGGCFEQTSSSNYPNLLILDYLKETDQAKPELARRARDLLERGYHKLVAFECQDPTKHQRRGYEWFGGMAAPHEALTAYGLMEFRDMARVYDVDPQMVERTRNYLLASKDGKGGFKRNPAAIDSFGRAPEAITNAYIVWALTEGSKDDDVSRELGSLNTQAKTSDDPYLLALAANALLNREKSPEAIALLAKLVKKQQQDGRLDAAQTSITGSGGRDLQIETTALTLLAWSKAKRPEQFTTSIQAAAQWIGKQRGGYGGFGSTQSTILALKALIAHARENKKTPEEGDVILRIGTREVARQHFAASVQEAIVLDLAKAEEFLKPGKNQVSIEITGKNVLPYTAAWSYRTLKPVSATDCPIHLDTRLDRNSAAEGETVRLTVVTENRSAKGQGMTVAIIGLPGGLSLPEDLKQLKDLARLRNNGAEPGPISAFETRGGELVLYWRDMAPNKKVEVNLDLICRVPGEYRGAASRAYLYYNGDHKNWVAPLKVQITAKGGDGTIP